MLDFTGFVAVNLASINKQNNILCMDVVVILVEGYQNNDGCYIHCIKIWNYLLGMSTSQLMGCIIYLYIHIYIYISHIKEPGPWQQSDVWNSKHSAKSLQFSSKLSHYGPPKQSWNNKPVDNFECRIMQCFASLLSRWPDWWAYWWIPNQRCWGYTQGRRLRNPEYP